MQNQNKTSTSESNVTSVPGLKYISNYINQEYQEQLIEMIDRRIWLIDFKRRVQHYGYKYDYKKRTVEPAMYLGDLPKWMLSIAQKLYQDNLFETLPDQVIINEYQPGQGIASHIDCIPCFGNTVISLSLGSTCIMEFTKISTLEKISILLNPCSLLLLQQEARYEWKHGIPPRKKDKFNGIEVARQRRISITFRKVIDTN